MMENVNNMTAAELKAFEKEQRKVNKIPGLFQIIVREVWKDKFAMLCVFVIVAIVVTAFIWGAHFYNIPVRMNPRYANRPPSDFGGLGTGSGGRPILNDLVLGTRTSLTIAFSVSIGSALIGYTVGLISGFFGGFFDWVIMRSIEIITMIPTIMLLIVVMAAIPESGTFHMIMVMIAFGWFGTAGTFRARVLQESSKDYISASKTLGTPNWKIMVKKIIPNVSSFLMVGLVLGIAGSIGLETGLTAIGHGLPFGTPSLGAMIAGAAADPTVLRMRPWQWVPAVVLVVVLTLAINGLGRAITRAVNPRKRRS